MASSSPKKRGGLFGHVGWFTARLNHRVEVVKGVLKEDCASILHEFFRSKRTK